jgi:hypothetical protein
MEGEKRLGAILFALVLAVSLVAYTHIIDNRSYAKAAIIHTISDNSNVVHNNSLTQNEQSEQQLNQVPVKDAIPPTLCR